MIQYKKLKKLFPAILCMAIAALSVTANSAVTPEHSGYQLEQMVVFSRHNIRAPLSEKGSVLDTVTPYSWIDWSSSVGELSLRGGTQETAMGQYFRKYLTEQGLMEENWVPGDGEVRFYANSLQRTIATAQYFATGLLPVADTRIEHHMELGTMDPTFNPVLTNVTEDLIEQITREVNELSDSGLQGYIESFSENFNTLEYVLDFSSSDYALENGIDSIPMDNTVLSYEEGEEPSMIGGLKLANTAADALILQYYEEADDEKAAFGHEMNEDQWKSIAEILTAYETVLFGVPSAAINIAHPVLQEIRQELTIPYRRFTFLCGHDSNVVALMTALQLESEPLIDTVCSGSPIGVKLVFERWKDAEGNAYLTASMVYQSTAQLRSNALLGINDAPVWMPLTFGDITANEDGMYALEDVLSLFDNCIAAY